MHKLRKALPFLAVALLVGYLAAGISPAAAEDDARKAKILAQSQA